MADCQCIITPDILAGDMAMLMTPAFMADWCVLVCSVAQFTTDDIGLLWLSSSNQTTAALTFLRTLAQNTSYGVLGKQYAEVYLSF